MYPIYSQPSRYCMHRNESVACICLPSLELYRIVFAHQFLPLAFSRATRTPGGCCAANRTISPVLPPTRPSRPLICFELNLQINFRFPFIAALLQPRVLPHPLPLQKAGGSPARPIHPRLSPARFCLPCQALPQPFSLPSPFTPWWNYGKQYQGYLRQASAPSAAPRDKLPRIDSRLWELMAYIHLSNSHQSGAVLAGLHFPHCAYAAPITDSTGFAAGESGTISDTFCCFPHVAAGYHASLPVTRLANGA